MKSPDKKKTSDRKKSPDKKSPDKKNISLQKKLPIAVFAFCVIAVIITVFALTGKRQKYVWYVDKDLETVWSRILRDTPVTFKEIQIWEGGKLPSAPGILISANLRHSEEIVTVYPRLSWELEHEGAIVLALDPWMVFRKHMYPSLTINRAMSDEGGSGQLLIPGRDPVMVKAWTSRFLQEQPGKFNTNEGVWREWEQRLFDGDRFVFGARGHDWQAVLFRLMGSETAWLYSPLSVIRRYRDPQKSLLQATAFPESGNNHSLLARLLWALPIGGKKDLEKFQTALEWLKSPETQTKIADSIEWIPADPYGTPYDPVSFSSQRVWLTAAWVYTIK